MKYKKTPVFPSHPITLVSPRFGSRLPRTPLPCFLHCSPARLALLCVFVVFCDIAVGCSRACCSWQDSAPRQTGRSLSLLKSLKGAPQDARNATVLYTDSNNNTPSFPTITPPPTKKKRKKSQPPCSRDVGGNTLTLTCQKAGSSRLQCNAPHPNRTSISFDHTHPTWYQRHTNHSSPHPFFQHRSSSSLPSPSPVVKQRETPERDKLEPTKSSRCKSVV